MNYGRTKHEAITVASTDAKSTQETMRPLVSVITPAYNAERYIGDAIRSVLAQTYTDWEMIIVDDGSTDRTCAIIESYAARDPRISLVRLKENSGPAVARNAAMARAQGRYLAFLDADDEWLPEKLAKQLRFMQERQIAFSFTKYVKVKENHTGTHSVVKIPDCVDYKRLLKHNVIGCLTVMLDTEKTGKVEMIDIRSRQDFALWLTLCKRGFKAYGLQEVLAKYRVRGRSVSSNKLKMAQQNWKIYREIKKFGFLKSVWYFTNYMFHALRKYLT